MFPIVPEHALISHTFRGRGYNVVESYGNCKEPVSTKPSAYGAPNDGVNGLPQATCGLEGGNPCVQADTSRCHADTIKVDKVTEVFCGEYMLEQYIGPGDSMSLPSADAASMLTLAG